jgi:hypothetical protein
VDLGAAGCLIRVLLMGIEQITERTQTQHFTIDRVISVSLQMQALI